MMYIYFKGSVIAMYDYDTTRFVWGDQQCATSCLQIVYVMVRKIESKLMVFFFLCTTHYRFVMNEW